MILRPTGRQAFPEAWRGSWRRRSPASGASSFRGTPALSPRRAMLSGSLAGAVGVPWFGPLAGDLLRHHGLSGLVGGGQIKVMGMSETRRGSFERRVFLRARIAVRANVGLYYFLRTGWADHFRPFTVKADSMLPRKFAPLVGTIRCRIFRRGFTKNEATAHSIRSIRFDGPLLWIDDNPLRGCRH